MSNYQLTIKIANSFVSGDAIPHAFVTISGPGLANPVTAGFYPQQSGDASGSGTVKNDAFTHKVGVGTSGDIYGEHPYDRTVTFDISASQAYDGLNYISRVANNPGTYQLLGAASQQNLIFPDGYQCTGFARDVAKAVGIEPKLFTGPDGAIRAYPGWLGPEFSFLDPNQIRPGGTTLTTADFNQLATDIYVGIKKNDPIDRTPDSIRNLFAGGTAPIVNTVVAPPADLGTPTRNSLDYFTTDSSNNHAVTIKSGGTLSDIWLTQKTAANGFANDKEFYAAVLVSNPGITDVNKIQAGQTIYLPQKHSDGAITYHYANGASIRSNAATGEYNMVIPDDSGKAIFTRTRDAQGNPIDRYTEIDATGKITTTLTTSDAWTTTETQHLTLLKNSATNETIAIYKSADLLANRQAGDVVQTTPQAEGGKAVATYNAQEGRWLTEKINQQGQVLERFTSSDNPLDASDPGHDGVGLWGGGLANFDTADFDSIDAFTGLPDYSRFTQYSDSDRDGHFDNLATQYLTGAREVTHYDNALDGAHATTATWLPNQSQISSLVLQTGDGASQLNPADLSPTQRAQYGLYSAADVAYRLDQLGFANRADFLDTGFSCTAPANAGLNAYYLGGPSSGADSYYWLTTTSGFYLDDYTGAWYDSANGVSSTGEDYTVSSVVTDAIGYLGSSANLVSPLILDLDGDGVATDLTGAYAGNVYFDIDADGFAERVGWTRDGLLAFDANGNGRIDDITELFGDDRMPAFDKLRDWDGNHDGDLDARDTGFGQLLVWRDANQDGVSQANELTLLQDSVLSIDLADTPYDPDGNGKADSYAQENYLSSAATFQTLAGQTREIADVHFLNDNPDTWKLGAQSQVYGAQARLDLEALMLPLSRGYGSLPSLHLAMGEDPTLKGLAKQLAALSADHIGEAAALVDDILLRWAGVEGNDPDARITAQGSYIDARKVDFIERFTGVTWQQRGAASFVGEDASLGLKKAWAGIEAMMLNRLLVQGPLKTVFRHAEYDFASDTLSLNDSLDTLLARAQTYATQTGAGQDEFWRLFAGILVETRGELGQSVEQIDATVSQAAGFELHLGTYIVTEADGPIFTGKKAGEDDSQKQGSSGLEAEPLTTNTYVGGQSPDTLTGSGANDYLFGKAGDDTLAGGGGDDYIQGNDGNDVLDGGNGFDRLEAGTGNDTLYGGEGSDVLLGGAGNDKLYGGAGDDLMEGGPGADYLDGGAGKDTIRNYADTGGYINLATGEAKGGDLEGDVFVNFENIDGSGYSDVLVGDDKDNFINGEGGDDILIGGGSNDQLFGAQGLNWMYGGEGDDSFNGYDGVDYIDGGAGWDMVSYNHPYLSVNKAGPGVYVDLALGRGLGGAAVGDTLIGIESVQGASKLNDVLIGDDNANELNGMGGMDMLYGGGGNDVLYAQEGGEHLFGGSGSDRFVMLNNTPIHMQQASEPLSSVPESNGGLIKIEIPDNAAYVHDFDVNDPNEQIDLSTQNLTEVVVRKRGNDSVVSLAGDRELLLLDVLPEQLTAASFVLPGGASSLTITTEDIPVALNLQGNAASNRLYGSDGDGDDVLTGFDGADALVAGPGNDALFGGKGDDYFLGGMGADLIDGGEGGADEVSYEDSYEGVHVNLNTGIGRQGTAAGDVLANVEILTGSSFGDFLRGKDTISRSAFIIVNGAEFPVLRETISGGAGDDTIDGGVGFNTLSGGAGTDRFIVQADYVDGSVLSIPGFMVSGPISVTTVTINDFELDNPNEKIDLTRVNLSGDYLVASINATQTELHFASFSSFLDLTLANLSFSETDLSIPQLPYLLDRFIFADGQAPMGMVFMGANGTIVCGTNGSDILQARSPGNPRTYPLPQGVAYVPWGGNDTINKDPFVLDSIIVTDQPGQALNIHNLTNNGQDLLIDFTYDPDIKSLADVVITSASGNTRLAFGSGQTITLNGINDTTTVYANLTAGNYFRWYDGAVHGTSGGDTLKGGKYADTINGGSGNDILDGEGGSDTLTGGDGWDTFVVGRHTNSTTRITDFQSWLHGDRIDLSEFSEIENFADLKDRTIQMGSDTRIDLGSSQILLISNLRPDQLLASSFIGHAGINSSPTGSVTISGTPSVDQTLSASHTLSDADGLGVITYHWLRDGVGSGATGNTYTLGLPDVGKTISVTASYSDGGGTVENITSASTTATTPAPVIGTSGDDTLTSLFDRDTLIGGAGDDNYIVNDGGDVIVENANEGTDTVQSGISWTLGSNLENLTLMGYSNANAGGNALDNVITGNGVNNILNGGFGADTLIGGVGDDLLDEPVTAAVAKVFKLANGTAKYYFNGVEQTSIPVVDGAMPTFKAGQRVQVVGSTVVDSVYVTPGSSMDCTYLGGGIDRIYLSGTLADYRVSLSGSILTLDRFNGLGAGQTEVVKVVGAYGNSNDELYFTDGYARTYDMKTRISAGQSIVLDSSQRSGPFDPALLLDEGADTLIGGTGNDTYVVDNAGDVVTELADEGTDSVQSYLAAYTLGANVENLMLMGYSNANAGGNTLDNVINGNGANNTLSGGFGTDTLIGGAGDDMLDGPVVSGVAMFINTSGTARYTMNGEEQSRMPIFGGKMPTIKTGQNVRVKGGNSEDIVYVTPGSSMDCAMLLGGIDRIFLSGALDDYRVTLTGSALNFERINGLDVGQTEFVRALSGNDLISDEIYFTDGYASTYTIKTRISAGQSIVLDSSQRSGPFDPALLLDEGADTLIGGTGNDTYVVDNAGDVVTELAEDGTDTVQSYLAAYTLGANVENLMLMGYSNANAGGNTLDNVINGNGANNTLSGSFGTDTLIGGAGDDVLDGPVAATGVTTVFNLNTGTARYFLNGVEQNNVPIIAGAMPTFKAGQSVQVIGSTGVESVCVTPGSSMDCTGLAGGIDRIYLSGTLADYRISLSGSILTLDRFNGLGAGQTEVVKVVGAYGNSNDELYFTDGYARTYDMKTSIVAGQSIVLDSSQRSGPFDPALLLDEGADTLLGGTGNDTYVVDNAGDVVTELADEGTDTVQSYLAAYTLGPDVENLMLMGFSNSNATGNAQDNVLTGNGANNIFDGGVGNDSLIGGSGNDTYLFNRGDGQDTVYDNDTTANNQDIARFSASIDFDQLWFRKSGNNLEASIIGTTDKVTIQNWYSGSAYHIERFEAGDKALLDSQVDALVQAMAAFSPPAAGQTSLPDAYRQALAPVLAANWQ